MTRPLIVLLLALLVAGCGATDEQSDGSRDERDARAPAAKSDDDADDAADAASDGGGADQPGEEQVDYMAGVRDAYGGDARFEACFDDAIEEMPPLPRDEWARVSGSFIAGCVQTDTGSGPIE